MLCAARVRIGGAAPASLPMSRMLMVLSRTPAQQRELDEFLRDAQAPSSLRYHHWLTPSEFGRRFGPSDAELQMLTSWLRRQGFESVRTSAGRTAIEFSGTAEKVQTALGTEIHKFVLAGEEYWANTSEPSLPASIAAITRGFVGLNNFAHHRAAPPVLPKNLRPLHNVLGSNEHAISPGDFAIIYNVKPLL